MYAKKGGPFLCQKFGTTVKMSLAQGSAAALAPSPCAQLLPVMVTFAYCLQCALDWVASVYFLCLHSGLHQEKLALFYFFVWALCSNLHLAVEVDGLYGLHHFTRGYQQDVLGLNFPRFSLAC